MIEMETSCDKYFRINAPLYYENTRKAIGNLVNADPSDIAIVENATVAVNSVLRSLPCLQEQTDIYFIYFNIAYGMVKQVLYYLRDTYKHVHLIEIVFDHESISSHANILAKVENVLEQYVDCNIVLAVYDHISSVPAVVFPVIQLTAMFKQRGILSLVDGAQAVGQATINIKELGADYYLSNCHKWLFAPKASAFLYVRKELQNFTRPASVSFGYQSRNFTTEFFWPGTRDLSAMFAVTTAIEWRNELGGEEAIMEYCKDLALKAGERVAQIWNTRVLIENDHRSEMNAALVNVEFPCDNKQTMDHVSKTLMSDHQSYVQTYEFNGKYYARFSCQIYNELKDYEYVANTILLLIRNG
jgi:selenocysteine lyase/cysteine desulfurase